MSQSVVLEKSPVCSGYGLPVLEKARKLGDKGFMTLSATQTYHHICERIEAAAQKAGRLTSDITLIAVTKTFDGPDIRPILEIGHLNYGENRVQESQSKWPNLRSVFPKISLHLIGPLQTNKAADAVSLFDVIHTIDRPRIAQAIAKEMKTQAKELELFIQVNTGDEAQKVGVSPSQADAFIADCRNQYGLEISGLMCIPPATENPNTHFELLADIAARNHLKNLSMGMSGDFETAIHHGATHVRVGSAIFGTR
jgi:PLP dependent protein